MRKYYELEDMNGSKVQRPVKEVRQDIRSAKGGDFVVHVPSGEVARIFETGGTKFKLGRFDGNNNVVHPMESINKKELFVEWTILEKHVPVRDDETQ